MVHVHTLTYTSSAHTWLAPCSVVFITFTVFRKQNGVVYRDSTTHVPLQPMCLLDLCQPLQPVHA